MKYTSGMGKTLGRMGRPPAGMAKDGTPERTSSYGKLTVSIHPSTRAMLEAISAVEGKPAWRIVDRGITMYAESMAPEDRKAVEAVVSRREAKRQP